MNHLKKLCNTFFFPLLERIGLAEFVANLLNSIVISSAGPMILRALWRIYRVLALVDHKILYYIRSICLSKKL